MTSEIKTLFSEQFVKNIPDDAIDGILFICNAFFTDIEERRKNPDYLIELFAAQKILFEFLDKHDIKHGVMIEFNMDLSKTESIVASHFRKFSTIYNEAEKKRTAKEKYDEMNARIDSEFGSYSLYELSDSQIEDIQNLINELRKQINECGYLEESHKLRMLKRLEKLQAELHIKMTNYDMIYGFAFEMNLLYTNIKEAKPLFDLTIKIANIVIQATAVANGLPPSPLLFPL